MVDPTTTNELAAPAGPADDIRGTFPGGLWTRHGEEFRSLRTRLDEALGGERKKVILVSSAAPKEGKTTVSLNLARALAQASWSTLLVDGDMRIPDVHKLFGLPLEPGLAGMLEARIFRNETVRKTDVPCLDVITAGKPEASPAELIASPFMPLLVGEARARYDYVVIDAPPLLSLTDTPLLARHVDGLVMVVRAGATPREVVVSALEQVADRRVFGVVVNGLAVDDPHYSYHYHYYGHDSGKDGTRKKV